MKNLLSKKFLSFGHRGNAASFPENTIASFKSAYKLGVDVLETDVHLTKDEVCVVHHDNTITRMTNGKGKIKKISFSQIKEFNSAYNFTIDKNKTFPFRTKNLKIMALSELFEKFPKANFNIDLKDKNKRLVEVYVKLINKYKVKNQVITTSDYSGNLKYLRKLLPGSITNSTVCEMIWIIFLFKIGLLKYKTKFKARVVQVPIKYGFIKIVNEKFIKLLHLKKVKIHVWTINNVKQINYLLDIGIDGIMSDNVLLLINVLKKRKII